jgi:hypothetical protein
MTNYNLLQEHYAPEELLQEGSFNDIISNLQNMSLNKIKKEIRNLKNDALSTIKPLKNHQKITDNIVKKYSKTLNSISEKNFNATYLNSLVGKIRQSVEKEMEEYGLGEYINDCANAFLINALVMMVAKSLVLVNPMVAVTIASTSLIIYVVYSCMIIAKFYKSKHK